MEWIVLSLSSLPVLDDSRERNAAKCRYEYYYEVATEYLESSCLPLIVMTGCIHPPFMLESSLYQYVSAFPDIDSTGTSGQDVVDWHSQPTRMYSAVDRGSMRHRRMASIRCFERKQRLRSLNCIHRL